MLVNTVVHYIYYLNPQNSHKNPQKGQEKQQQQQQQHNKEQLNLAYILFKKQTIKNLITF